MSKAQTLPKKQDLDKISFITGVVVGFLCATPLLLWIGAI